MPAAACRASRALRRAALALSLGLAAACGAPDSDAAEAMIDQVSQDLQTAPAATGLAFAAHARRYGPGFQAARLRHAEMLLELDGLKRGARPRLSLLLQGSVQFTDSAELALRGRSHSFVIEWDFLRTAYVLLRRTPEVFAKLLSQEAKLAWQQAEKQLLDQLEAMLQLQLDLDEAALQIKAQQCRTAEMREDLSAGLVAAGEVTAQAAVTAQQVAVLAARRELAQASEARLAQISGGAALHPRPALSALTPERPAKADAGQCYAGSALKARNETLQLIATEGLAAARIDRWLALSGILPNQIGPETAARPELLLTLILPLIDQGRGDRQVQAARIAVARALLAAQESEAAFMMAHASISLDLAEARLARAALTPPAALENQVCGADQRQQQHQLQSRRLRLKEDHAEASLRLLCSPAAGAEND